MQLPAVTRLLDLGCGTCADAEVYFAAGAERVCGVDWDWLALKAARHARRSKMLCLLYADVRTIAFAPRAFDAILIRHPDVARAPQTWQTALRNSVRWLRQVGRLLITTYSLDELTQMRAFCASIAALRALQLDERQLAPVPLSGRDRHVLCYALNT
ncbi:MAG: class I SAM-dependent methyltransferase [Anaerolineae bacterium]|nr:class I SAM-dependent methyltransferase [Anaerolineae bacterium]